MTETTTKIIEVLASGFFGALAAYLFNLFHWRTTEKIRKIEQLCTNISRITDKLEEETIRYWLTPPPNNDIEKALTKQLEISIKSLIRTQVSLTEKLSEISSQKNKRDALKKSKELNDRLYEIATGEEFESKSRKAKPGKCNIISRTCAEIRANLTSISI